MDFIKNWIEEWSQENTIETRSHDVCQNTEQGDSHHSAVPVKIGIVVLGLYLETKSCKRENISLL